jgi:hypothetical protein
LVLGSRQAANLAVSFAPSPVAAYASSGVSPPALSEAGVLGNRFVLLSRTPDVADSFAKLRQSVWDRPIG